MQECYRTIPPQPYTLTTEQGPRLDELRGSDHRKRVAELIRKYAAEDPEHHRTRRRQRRNRNRHTGAVVNERGHRYPDVTAAAAVIGVHPKTLQRAIPLKVPCGRLRWWYVADAPAEVLARVKDNQRTER